MDIALITGAAGGVGQAAARELAQAGWRLAVVSRDAGRLSQAFGAEHLQIAADVSTPEGARAAVDACVQSLGAPPAALVHAAGSTLIQAAHRTAAEQWRQVIAANLDSAFFTLQAWAQALLAAKQPGAAVLFSSVVSRVGVANHEAIAAAKGGIEALARSMAASYSGQRLRVNVLAPGMTETPMTAGMLRVDAVREAATKQYPLGSIGTAEELAQLAAYLVSDKAARITGQTIAVDGGFTAVRPLVR